MEDLQVCSLRPKGVVSPEDRLCSPLSISNPNACSISAESWEAAEETTHLIVCRIQPTLVSEQKRQDVIEYVQGLVRGCLGYEIFPYGSVPLKTYLPDGDIDLTALSSPTFEETLVYDVHAVLMGEEHNEAAQYEVKDVHRIDAEVKLVKCLVENIVVDISFNQLGGLCTLCFLELVDRLVGKDHLFKRSIILIKAWCYYESRILGAHHGLISTYALETLVLYIFHLFHSSMNGPLAVLHRFLEYFSTFDWENYCISLNGPVCKSSLPDIVAEELENGRDDLLLSEEFLRRCAELFSVPSRGAEADTRAFSIKHLNIIDPLKENNNLGRSVNRGNFYRIRSAFKYGARKLSQILLLPAEQMPDELNKFFANTLWRHCNNYWTDRYNPNLASGARASENWLSPSHFDMCSEDNVLLRLSHSVFSDGKLLGFINESDPVELSCHVDGNVVTGMCLRGEAVEVLTSELLTMKSRNDPSGFLMLGSGFDYSLLEKSHCEPPSSFPGLFRENGESSPEENHFVGSNSLCSCSFSESNAEHGLGEIDADCVLEGAESFKSMLDLNGYGGHLGVGLYSQSGHLYAVPASEQSNSPMPLTLQNQNQWETSRQSHQSTRNVNCQMNSNRVSRPQFHSGTRLSPSAAAYSLQGKGRQQGTSTYFHDMDYYSNWDGPSSSTRKRFPLANSQSGFSGGFPQENTNELPQEEYPVLGGGKSKSSDFHRPQKSMWGSSSACGFSNPAERLEFGSQRFRLGRMTLSEESTYPDLGTTRTWGSAADALKPVLENSRDRVAVRSYHLKNETDFPPLTH